MKFRGRKIFGGYAIGEALVSSEAISFFGGVDPDTGKVIEKGHSLEDQIIKNKILVFPQGKGSTVGSYTLYQLKKNEIAPKAIINEDCETIVAVGAIISEIPCVDKIDIKHIKNGSQLEVKADEGIVNIK